MDEYPNASSNISILSRGLFSKEYINWYPLFIPQHMFSIKMMTVMCWQKTVLVITSWSWLIAISLELWCFILCVVSSSWANQYDVLYSVLWAHHEPTNMMFYTLCCELIMSQPIWCFILCVVSSSWANQYDVLYSVLWAHHEPTNMMFYTLCCELIMSQPIWCFILCVVSSSWANQYDVLYSVLWAHHEPTNMMFYTLCCELIMSQPIWCFILCVVSSSWANQYDVLYSVLWAHHEPTNMMFYTLCCELIMSQPIWCFILCVVSSSWANQYDVLNHRSSTPKFVTPTVLSCIDNSWTSTTLDSAEETYLFNSLLGVVSCPFHPWFVEYIYPPSNLTKQNLHGIIFQRKIQL